MNSDLSPTSDTRNLTVQVYDGHPTYICSKCSVVIVSSTYQKVSLIVGWDVVQALQDEMISKAFSGRDGRG